MKINMNKTSEMESWKVKPHEPYHSNFIQSHYRLVVQEASQMTRVFW